ncbi:A-adding tRNA nucleotidyltransferase [Anaerolineales bacterium]|nr:A-adding tRNA nucleotidyltransferase [Anaerolineales bacterium]
MQKDLTSLLRDPNLIPSEKQNLLSEITAQTETLGMPCYVVGGFVRDLLLGQPINDLDIVVEGDAIALGKSLVEKYGGNLTPHYKFHTAIWDLPSSFNLYPSSLDLITARSETYSQPGALPTIKPSTIEDDLRRRDFTINAMAIRLDGSHFGELLDPLNGQADLEEKAIRVLHPRSFIDDPTRIFRAVRYEQRYSFILHSSSFTLISPESLAVIQTLSGERIRHELDLIFEEDNSHQMIVRLGELDVFKWIHPELRAFNGEYSDFLEMDTSLDVPASRTTMGYMLWLMDLSEAAILSIARRLNFSSDLTHSVWGASQLKKSLPFLVNSKPSVWAFALEKLPLLSIYAVYLVSGEKALLDYLSFWRHVKSHTTGDDLKARGLEPGPRYGEILTKLRAAWLDGEVNSEKEEKELLNRLL